MNPRRGEGQRGFLPGLCVLGYGRGSTQTLLLTPAENLKLAAPRLRHMPGATLLLALRGCRFLPFPFALRLIIEFNFARQQAVLQLGGQDVISLWRIQTDFES